MDAAVATPARLTAAPVATTAAVLATPPATTAAPAAQTPTADAMPAVVATVVPAAFEAAAIAIDFRTVACAAVILPVAAPPWPPTFATEIMPIWDGTADDNDVEIDIDVEADSNAPASPP